MFQKQPGVTPESYGLNSATTRLQFWHSWEVPAQPAVAPRVLVVETNTALRAGMQEPDLVDSILDFGDLWFPGGRSAMVAPAAPSPDLPVDIRVANPQGDPSQTFSGKEWVVQTNGTFLIESQRWNDLAPRLAGLPAIVSADPPASLRELAALGKIAPVPVVAGKPGGRMRVAARSHPRKEFVWAYVVISTGATSYTFGSGTYFLSSHALFSGTVTFSAGSVLKFAPNVYLLVYGPIVCNGSSGSPTILTSMSDDLFGEMIFGTTHSPTNNASQAIWEYYETSDVTFAYLRIRYAQTAVQFDANPGTGLTHQFDDSAIELSATGLAADNCTVSLSSSTYCVVSDLTTNLGSATFSGSLANACSGNIGGIPDSWFMQYFGSLTAYGTNSDPNGDGNTLAYDYQNGLNPAQTMVVVWGNDVDASTNIPPSGLGNAQAVAGALGSGLVLENNGAVESWGCCFVSPTPSGGTNGIAIAASQHHMGVVTKAGGLYTWGIAATPPTTTNAVALSLGNYQGIALLSTGVPVVWDGNNVLTNVPANATNNILSVAAGFDFDAVLQNTGTVAAWGPDAYGVTNIPSGLSGVVAIAAGYYHMLALLNNGTVVAWGAGTNGDTSGEAFGQSIVPSGLTNVIAIAAGGNHSMALKSDGTVSAWGDVPPPLIPLTGVVGIGCSDSNCMAIRSIPLIPFIAQGITATTPATNGQPLTLTVIAEGLAALQYQWQTNGVNISGATSSTYTIPSWGSANYGTYSVIVSNGAGSATNSAVVSPSIPVITSVNPTSGNVLWLNPGTYGVLAAPATDNLPSAWPLTYQWQFAGTNLSNGSSSNYVINPVQTSTPDGFYTLAVSNSFGGTNATFAVHVMNPGSAVIWGYSGYGQLNRPESATNLISIACGIESAVAVTDSGVVLAWGSNPYGQTNVPTGMPAATAVASGPYHCLALLANGGVVGWGANGSGETNVPSTVTAASAVAAGNFHSLVLMTNGTVAVWGDDMYHETDVPSALTNAGAGVSAIAAGGLHSLALRTNGTVQSWGYNYYGECNVPSSLTNPGSANVTAIAAGYYHSMALLSNGTVVVWGDNGNGQTNVPASVTNAMAIAAGAYSSFALLNDGSVVGWGYNTYDQCDIVSNLPPVKMIAAGYYATLAVTFSPWTQYPINVANDLLLIYNTNSSATSSVAVLNYYLTNRPMVGAANLLALNLPSTNGSQFETVEPTNLPSLVLAPIQNWLAQNPTKRPQYVILFPNLPTRVNSVPGFDYNPGGEGPECPSVQYQIHSGCATNWLPFVTTINLNTVTDCTNYINKLAYFGSHYSPGSLVISASAGGYANTNYYFDDSSYPPYAAGPASNAVAGVEGAGVATNAITYTYVAESPVGNTNYAGQITSGSNVSGYLSWGGHSALSPICPGPPATQSYATNGLFHYWTGDSGWWIIQTIESYNGVIYSVCGGNYDSWFESSSFGGSNYSNTPVGAVSNVDEPGEPGSNDPGSYFALWAQGKNFGQCAWISQQANAPYPAELQAVGDPFIKR